MVLIPGDLVLVTDIEFRPNVFDSSLNGRPCLVLYSDNETVTVLLSTGQLHQYDKSNSHVFYDWGYKLSLINISDVYVFNKNQVIHPLRNIGKDFFRIIYQFQKVHIDSRNQRIIDCCKKLERYSYMEDVLKPILNHRYMELKKRSRELAADKVLSNDEDPIQKKMTKRKVCLYKKNKQLVGAYSE